MGECLSDVREHCGPFCQHSATQKILLLAATSALLLFVQILNAAGVNVYVLGILPRTPEGLVGVVGAPWVHVSWAHLAGNLVGWFTLGFLVLLHGRRVFLLTFAWCSVVGGFVVWIVARPVRHVGLSGVIFGFFGFLLFAALWERPIRVRTVVSLVVAFLIYGGTLLTGVVVPNMNVSWESHAVGFVAGGVWALLHFRFLLRNPKYCSFVGAEAAGAPESSSNLPVTAPPRRGNQQPAGPDASQKTAGGPWWKFGRGGKKDPASKPAEPAASSTSSGPPPAMNPTYASPAPATAVDALSPFPGQGGGSPSSLQDQSNAQGAYKNPFLEG